MLSILAGIQSAQQGWLLIRMPPLQAHSASQDDVRLVLRSVLLQALDGSLPVCDTSGHVTGKEKIDWNMVYIWQVPIMLMTYAWVTFFLAMTLHVCTPLIEADPWGRGHKVSMNSYSLNRETNLVDCNILPRGFRGPWREFCVLLILGLQKCTDT